MTRYEVGFILQSRHATEKSLKNALSEFGERLEISGASEPESGAGEFKIRLTCEEPTVIFDISSQFGRIKTVRIDEIKEGA